MKNDIVAVCDCHSADFVLGDAWPTMRYSAMYDTYSCRDCGMAVGAGGVVLREFSPIRGFIRFASEDVENHVKFLLGVKSDILAGWRRVGALNDRVKNARDTYPPDVINGFVRERARLASSPGSQKEELDKMVDSLRSATSPQKP